jgi:uncharacterized protein YceK
MKKLFILLSFVLSGCGCVLSQIPPQYIYSGAGCTGSLPDYRLKITTSDNCEIASFTQLPTPGFLLTATNKITNVTIKAMDASGNFRQVIFSVALLDTIKPVLTIDPALLSYQQEQLNDIYTAGDKIVGQLEKNLNNSFPFDSFPGLREKLADSSYYKQMLVVASLPEINGVRHRMIMFADSVKLITRTK